MTTIIHPEIIQAYSTNCNITLNQCKNADKRVLRNTIYVSYP